MKKVALLFGVGALVGALSLVYNLGQDYAIQQAGLLAIVDAVVFAFFAFATFSLLHNRLKVFSPQQQWLLRALFYTIALVMAYFFSALIKINLLNDSVLDGNGISNFFWDTLVDLSAIPQGQGTLSELFPPALRQIVLTFIILILLISVASILGSWVEIRWQESRFRQARERAELTALRAQMEPHFLFNTLNTITSLVKHDAEKAEKLLIELSEMLRYLFQNANTDRVALKDELHFTRLYVHLIQARFSENLTVRWEVEPVAEGFLVPAFMLQPLLENAVRHGWIDQSNPLEISIRVNRKASFLCLQIVDNGQGIAPVMQAKYKKPGHALANLEDRLKLFYGRTDLLKLESKWKKGTLVEICIPE
ncbi:MAG: histidine kinase [Deferribacteres bacterium]|nr:histidine kinase [candidate division KSB1 bacterium]MCB9501712.1 histidine kinase [Deferribacteres bacterium]